MPTNLATVYCDSDDVAAILSTSGINLRLDDTTADVLTNQGINWGAARINDFCAGRYDPADMVSSWTINWWNTVLASRFICVRRVNPLPNSIKDLYVEAMQDMLALRKGEYSLGDINSCIVDSPAWSNVRVPVWYLVDRIRVERRQSEGTPRRIAPPLDYLSEFVPRNF